MDNGSYVLSITCVCKNKPCACPCFRGDIARHVNKVLLLCLSPLAYLFVCFIYRLSFFLSCIALHISTLLFPFVLRSCHCISALPPPTTSQSKTVITTPTPILPTLPTMALRLGKSPMGKLKVTNEERFPEMFAPNRKIDRRTCTRVVPMKVLVLGMCRTGTACKFIRL